MIAMVVLAVGLLAAAGLICAAIATNAVPKLGSTSATLAESTMERILAIPSDATGPAALTSLTDCAGNNFAVNTLAGGSVDFGQPALPGYSMLYVNCASGQNMTYDVRWTIEAGPTPSTQLITVSARVLPGSAGPQGVYLGTTTLRTLRGGS
jgi:Tfp pilus assembly protein PilV